MVDAPEDDFVFSAAVAEFAMLLSDSDYKADAGYDHILAQIANVDLSDEYRAEFKTLVEAVEQN